MSDLTKLKVAAAEQENRISYVKLESTLGDILEESLPTPQKNSKKAKRKSSYLFSKESLAVAAPVCAVGFIGVKHFKLHKRFIPASLLAAMGTAKTLKWVGGGVACICALWYSQHMLHKACRLEKKILEKGFEEKVEKVKAKLREQGKASDEKAKKLIERTDQLESDIKAVKSDLNAAQKEIERIKKRQAELEDATEHATQAAEESLKAQEKHSEAVKGLHGAADRANKAMSPKLDEATRKLETLSETIVTVKKGINKLHERVNSSSHIGLGNDRHSPPTPSPRSASGKPKTKSSPLVSGLKGLANRLHLRTPSKSKIPPSPSSQRSPSDQSPDSDNLPSYTSPSSRTENSDQKTTTDGRPTEERADSKRRT